MTAAETIAEARALIEPLRATVLWGNANPDVMKAAETLDALADLADAQAQEIARLRGLLNDERLLAVLGHAEDTAPSAIWAGMPSWFEDVSAALGSTP